MAVKEGIVDAAVLDVFSGLRLEKEGYKQLVFVKDITELPATGLATHDRIREKRSEVRLLLSAILKANGYIKSRAADLPELVRQYMHLPGIDEARTAFDAYRGLWSENGLTSDEGLRNVAALGGVPENTPLHKLAETVNFEGSAGLYQRAVSNGGGFVDLLTAASRICRTSSARL